MPVLLDSEKEQLFKKLWEQLPYVRRYTRRRLVMAGILNDADAAEDVVQSAYLKAYEKMSQLRERERARNWLYTIVRNEVNGFLRGHATAAHLDDESLYDPESLPATRSNDFGWWAERLGKLKPQHLDLLLLYAEVEGQYRHIAELEQEDDAKERARLRQAVKFARDSAKHLLGVGDVLQSLYAYGQGLSETRFFAEDIIFKTLFRAHSERGGWAYYIKWFMKQLDELPIARMTPELNSLVLMIRESEEASLLRLGNLVADSTETDLLQATMITEQVGIGCLAMWELSRKAKDGETDFLAEAYNFTTLTLMWLSLLARHRGFDVAPHLSRLAVFLGRLDSVRKGRGKQERRGRT